MTLHAGSSAMAQHLDRFSFQAESENIAGEATRLNVDTDTLRCYLDGYGQQPVTVKTWAGMAIIPACEAEIRWQVLGEEVRRIN